VKFVADPFLPFLFTILGRYGNVRGLSKLMAQGMTKNIIGIAIIVITGISPGG
jgi:hypothetical protein